MENFRSSSIFIEEYEYSSITLEDRNNYGQILVDKNGNYLNNLLYQSNNKIEECVEFSGSDNLLIYTKTQFSILNSDKSMTGDIYFKPNEIITYKRNVRKIQKEFDGYSTSYETDVDGVVDIMRVELNGRKTDDYNLQLSAIDFSSNDIVSTFGNTMTIYYIDPLEQDFSTTIAEFKYYAPYKYDMSRDELFNGIQLSALANFVSGDNNVTLLTADATNDIKIGNYIVINDDRYRVIAINSGTTFRVDRRFTYNGNSEIVKVFKASWIPELDGNFSDSINYSFKSFTGAGGYRDFKTKLNSTSQINMSMRSNENYFRELYDIEGYLLPVITTTLRRFIKNKDVRFRVILAFDEFSGNNKKVYYTNCSFVEGVNYNKDSDVDKYQITLDFEKRVTLIELGYDPAKGLSELITLLDSEGNVLLDSDGLILKFLGGSTTDGGYFFTDDSTQVGKYIATVD